MPIFYGISMTISFRFVTERFYIRGAAVAATKPQVVLQMT
jgi:hypothetical protein